MGLAPPLNRQHFLCHFTWNPEENVIVIMLLTGFWSNSKVKVREMHFSFWETY